jgi:hypothetical protein
VFGLSRCAEHWFVNTTFNTDIRQVWAEGQYLASCTTIPDMMMMMGAATQVMMIMIM